MRYVLDNKETPVESFSNIGSIESVYCDDNNFMYQYHQYLEIVFLSNIGGAGLVVRNVDNLLLFFLF